MSSYLKGLANRVNGVEKESFTKELDINLLVPSENNFYGIREIEELAESIKENGLMHNLVVRKKDDGTYEIISGERRFRALKSLGYEKIPCQVRDITDLDAEIMLIQANVEQRELLPSEKMEGIKRLKAIYEQKKANGEELPKGKLRDLIGQDMNLSGTQVGRYQKVDKDLINPLKEKLDKEEITLTQAHTLSSLSKEEQNIIHDEIKDLDHKESKEEVETLINGIKQPVTNKKDEDLLKEMYPDKNKILDKDTDDKVINNTHEINSLAEKFVKKAKTYKDMANVKQTYITNIREQITKMLEYDSHPTVIVKDDKINAFFYKVDQVTISEKEIQAIASSTVLNFYTKCIVEVYEIPGIKEKLFKAAAYKINEGVYIYFANYNNEMKYLYKKGLLEISNK